MYKNILYFIHHHLTLKKWPIYLQFYLLNPYLCFKYRFIFYSLILIYIFQSILIYKLLFFYHHLWNLIYYLKFLITIVWLYNLCLYQNNLLKICLTLFYPLNSLYLIIQILFFKLNYEFRFLPHFFLVQIISNVLLFPIFHYFIN